MRIQLLLLALFSFVCYQNLSAQCTTITVNAGQDQEVCGPGGGTTLNGSVSGPYEYYSWSPSVGLSDPNILNPIATISTPTTYTLTAEAIDPYGINLIQNGDFEQGNTGFTSEYGNNQTFFDHPYLYAVLPGSQPVLPASTNQSCGDHTSGSGNMMILYGPSATKTHPGNIVIPAPPALIWCQTVPVTPNTNYFLSAWLARINLLHSFVPDLEIRVNGQNISIANPSSSLCVWTNFSGTWNSGSSVTANVCISVPTHTFVGPITYALDDILMTEFCYVSDDVTVDFLEIEAIAPAVQILPCDVSSQGFALDGSASTSGPNFTYQWTTNDGNIVSGWNDPIAYVDGTGSYTLTVIYTSGVVYCTDIAFVTVIDDPNQPFASAAVSETLDCFNPTIEIDGTGSSEGTEYTYLWTTSDGNIVNGEDSLLLTVDAGGTYDLLVTNTDNNCTAEASVTVEEDLEIPDADADTNGIIDCINDLVEVDGNGSSEGGDFSYEWTTNDGNIVSGEFELIAEVDTAGTYTITVTNDINGCTNTAEVTVDEDLLAPIPEIESPAQVDCTNAEIELDASNSSGQGNLSAEWTTNDGIILSGEFTLTPTVEGAGTYTLTITDDVNGCTETDTVTVEENLTPPVPEIETPGVVDCNTSSLSLDASNSSGQGTLSAEWSTNDGIILSGGQTLNPDIDGAGTYALIITDDLNGCTAMDEVTVLSDFDEPSIDIQAPEMLTCLVTSIFIDATNSSTGKYFSYEWVTPDGNITNGASSLQPEVDQPGNYILTITNDLNGCTSTDNTTVTGDTVVPTSDAGDSTKIDCDFPVVELDASNSSQGDHFEYQWTTTNGNIVGGENELIAEVDADGDYVFTVTNTLNNCIERDTVNVSLDDNVPIADAGTAEDFNCLNTEVNLDGQNSSQGNHTYQWIAVSGNIANGENTLTPTVDSAGIYVIEVTDTLNNCVSTDTIVVEENFVYPIADAGPNLEIPCHPDTLELMSNNSSQGNQFEYSWTTSDGNIVNGAMELMAEVDAVGTYSLQITDKDNGCTATTQVEVVQAESPSLNIQNQVNVDCYGNANGSATVIGTGGTPNYTFEWSNGGMQATQTNLNAGIYVVTITDVNTCKSTIEVTISEPGLLIVDLEGTAESGLNMNDGTATAIPSGGSSDYSFEWSNGETIPTISNLVPGEYCVSITDQNGCTTTGCYVVSSFSCAGVSVNISSTDVSCFEGNDGEATIQMIGGTAPFLYQWSNGQSGESLTDLSAQTYQVTVTDDNDCAILETITISQPSPILISILAVTDADCAGSASGSAMVEANGGTPDFNYEWSNGSMESFIENVLPGMYMVTVTDLNNCMEKATIEIDGENDTTAPVVMVQNITVILDEDGMVSITPEMVDNGTYDNCELESMNLDISEFSCMDVGEVMVTLTANDLIGNSASGTAIVTVLDETAPSLICPKDIFSNFCTSPISYPEPIAEDECGDTNMELITGLPSGEIFPMGTTLVEYMATDNAGNSSSCSFTVTVLTDMNADVSVIEPNCANMETGEATLMVEGGTPPYQYLWNDSNMQSMATATNLTAGIYSVTITDDTGCEIGATVTVTEPDPLELDIDIIEPNCFGEATGIATAITSGGTLPYIYQWDDPDMQMNQIATGLTAGMYEIVVLDSNNCEITSTVNIAQPTEIQITLDELVHETSQNADGLISISPSGGTNMGYTFEWTFNGDFYSNEEDIQDLTAGEYCITISDQNDCIQTQCFTVEVVNNTYDQNLAHYIGIAPNPTSGLINVQFNLPKLSEVSLDFHDVLGRNVLEVKKRTLEEGSIPIDLSELSAGVYFLRIGIGEGFIVERVVVE